MQQGKNTQREKRHAGKKLQDLTGHGKSIVYREDTYRKERVRYSHLNPVRAGIVEDLRELHRYHYSDGHTEEAVAGCELCTGIVWH